MSHLLHHLLRASAARAPSDEALVVGDHRLDYASLARRCSALASGLRASGIGRGDRVGVLLEPGVEQCVAIMAVSEAGGVVVPINTVLFPQQVGHIVDDCEMSALVTDGERIGELVRGDVDLSRLRFVVTIGAVDERPEGTDVLDLDDVADGDAAALADVAIGRDLAALLYTSGSTGSPKGVMVSHEQLLAGSRIVVSYLGITASERILGVLPLSFDAGLNQMITAFDQGATFLPCSFTFAREIAAIVEAERVTALAGVPTLWHLFVHPRSGARKRDLSSLRYVTNTGGHLACPVLDDLRALLPTTDVVLMYGLTEAFRSTYLPPSELDRRPDSMGRAIPETEVMVVRQDGTECEVDEVGELVHRGPTVSMGYWGRPELTAKRLRPHPTRPEETLGERVCYSGDLVRRDADGFLYFVGRADAMIKTSGYRVSPTEVESAAISHGAVNAAAAVGVPDPALGQAIVLFAAVDDPSAVRADDLKAHCAAERPAYMVPRQVVVVDELPTTGTGKVDYPALRARAAT